VVSADGGEPRQLHPEFDLAQWAMWAPEGDNYYFAGRSTPREEIDYDYWISSLDGSRLVSTGLRRKLMSLGLANADARVWLMQWMKDYLYVVTSDGDVQKLWRIRIDPRSWRLSGSLEQLSSFLARQPQTTIAENGRFVIADSLPRISDWVVPLDPTTGRITGAMRPVTGELAEQQREFLAGDGHHIAYATRGGGEISFWLKDLTSGVESIIQTIPSPRSVRAISYDAKRVYYETNAGGQVAVYRAVISEGTGQKLCDRCCLLALSQDEKTMLSCTAASGGIVLRHLDSGAITELLSPGVGGGSYQFSPDGQWLAFQETTDYFQSRIVIVPVRNQPVPAEEWIVVADGPAQNRVPAWPPNGPLLYFHSNRSGWDGVWAQRLDAHTKRPVGQPLEVYRDHLRPFDGANLVVAADKMLLRRVKLTSGLWTGRLP